MIENEAGMGEAANRGGHAVADAKRVRGSAEGRSGFSIMRRMLGLVRPLSAYMVLAVAAGTAGHLCATFLTVVAVWAACGLAAGNAQMALGTVGAVLVGMAVARGVLHYVEQTCNHYIAFTLLADIRSRVFGALRKLAPAKLAGADKGDLISRLTADIELLEVFYAHTISPVCIAIATSVFMLVFFASLHFAFALVALAAYLCIGLLMPLAVSKTMGSVGLETRQMAGKLSSFVLDSLRGLREVVQFGAGNARTFELNALSAQLVGAKRKQSARGATGSAAAGALIVVFSVCQLVLGVALFRVGAVDAQAVALATVALFSSFGPTSALAALGSTLQGTLASGARVLDVLDEVPIVREQTCGQDVAFTGAQLADATFSYGDEVILENVDLQVKRGEVLGISGKSGSGKSTLCRLLMRFWDVDSGEVSISDVNVKDVNTASLRDNEALVEQDTFLFHDTIRDNLLVAAPDATQERIEQACKAAAIHDFILTLPKGYDTMVGELGGTLSGGERQRLGLARAFLHDAPFLLLDEPTSNLDSLNEATILKSLDDQRGKRTVLLVSHRASTMAIADRVVSMDSGRLS